MSIGSTLKHVLGIVAGILIPGASKDTTNLTHSIQQEIADAFGEGARDLAAELKLDTTGMSGPDKVFAIVKAIVAETKKQGFAGDLKVLEAVAVDVAQAAYRASEPEIEAGIVAVGAALTTNPLVKVGVGILAGYVEQLADKAADVSSSSIAAAASVAA